MNDRVVAVRAMDVQCAVHNVVYAAAMGLMFSLSGTAVVPDASHHHDICYREMMRRSNC